MPIKFRTEMVKFPYVFGCYNPTSSDFQILTILGHLHFYKPKGPSNDLIYIPNLFTHLYTSKGLLFNSSPPFSLCSYIFKNQFFHPNLHRFLSSKCPFDSFHFKCIQTSFILSKSLSSLFHHI